MAELPQRSGPPRVFLSYASQDAEAARRIADSLALAGIEAWFDQSELRGGDAWDQKIRRQIRECQLFVPVISSNTQGRAEGYFRLEWHLAEQRSFLMAGDQPFIVPVVIDSTVEEGARVPDRFKERQWTRLPAGGGAAEFAHRLLGLAGGIAPAPSPAVVLDRSIPAARSERSVAVLPFANLSADRENEYFSDGISDELLTLLQSIPGLRVAARTSAFSFKGKSATAEEIGSRLGVAHLVEGSVQKSGSKVKISARLSSTGGEVRWSRSFTRELSDVFALQEEIAGAIVGELKGQLSGENSEVALQLHQASRGGSKDPRASQHYFVGRHFFAQASSEAMDRAIAELEAAVAIDPAFALAWSSLGRCLTWKCGYLTMSQAEFGVMYEKAVEALERALALEPDLAQAHTLKAWLEYSFEFKIEPAAARIRAVLQRHPNDPETMTTASGILSGAGFPEEGLDLIRRACAIDPVNVRVRTQLTLFLARTGQFDEARIEAKETLKLGPTSVFAQSLLGFVELLAGRLDAVEKSLEGATSNWSVEWLRCLVLAERGPKAEAVEAAHRYGERYGDSAAAQTAVIFASVGDADQTFVWLENARKHRDPGLLAMRPMRFYDSVRSDPRWDQFWTSMGIAPSQGGFSA